MAVVFRLPSLVVERDENDRAERGPSLVLLQGGKSRGAGIAATLVGVALTLLLVVAVQATMAQRQMELDRINSDITRARRHFETLRAERAELQSPTHLIARANQIGLVPGMMVRVVEIPADVAAEVVATTGKIDDDVADSPESPLDRFSRLKPAVVGGP